MIKRKHNRTEDQKQQSPIKDSFMVRNKRFNKLIRLWVLPLKRKLLLNINDEGPRTFGIVKPLRTPVIVRIQIEF